MPSTPRAISGHGILVVLTGKRVPEKIHGMICLISKIQVHSWKTESSAVVGTGSGAHTRKRFKEFLEAIKLFPISTVNVKHMWRYYGGGNAVCSGWKRGRMMFLGNLAERGCRK